MNRKRRRRLSPRGPFIPRQGLTFLAKTSSGLIDSIGVSSNKIFDTRPAASAHEAEKSLSAYFQGTSAYGSLSTPEIVSGNFTIRFYAKYITGVLGVIIGEGSATSFICFESTGTQLRVKIAGSSYYFNISAASDPYLYEIKRIGNQLTVKQGSTTAPAQTCSTADWQFSKIGANIFSPSPLNLYKGNLWDLYIEDVGGTILENTLAHGAGALLKSSIGQDIPITAVTWTQSVEFGHTWNTTGYFAANGTGAYADGARIPISYAGIEGGTVKNGPFLNNLNLVPKPKVIFTLDDGNASDYTVAFPYMSANGIRGASAIVSSVIGTGGKLSVAQMSEMAAAGWEFVNHTNGYDNLTGMTYAQQLTTITTCRDWLTSNGFTAGASHLIYPMGDKNTDTDQIITELGLISGRGTTDALTQSSLHSGDIDFYDLPVAGYLEELTLAQAQAKVDSAISQNKVCIFLIHNISAVSQFTTTEFQALIDYVKTKIDAGLIENIGYCEWVNGLKNFSNPFSQSLFDFSIVPSSETYSIDDGTFYSGVNPKIIKLSDMASWVGPRKFYRSGISAGAYATDLTGSDLLRANRYFRIAA
jgi:peptidoglycan/xylan/chitin deacetylase (PgdA/CDA1 family)